METQQSTLVVIAGLLSLERIFYSIVCHAPHAISKLAGAVANARGKEPEFIFKFVHLFKVVQIIAFATWYYSHFGASIIAKPSPATSLLAFILLAIGQTLNFLVWYRIGVEGVCYGVKYGRNVPWCTKFPYNVMSDPQYVGAILTVWGLFLFASESAPRDWMAIPFVETLLYIVSMRVEY